MNLRWRNILLVALAIVAMAYSRWIAAFLRSLKMGEPLGTLWGGFGDEIRVMPRLGHYTVTLLVLMLLYISAYMLLLNRIRRG